MLSLDEPQRPWYHGSPMQLIELQAGSTITQDMALARVFSHKPSLVCIEDSSSVIRLRHNGTLPGYLYRIAEEVAPEDVYPHPRTTMPAGAEWITRRPLRVALIGPTEALPAELLDENAVRELRARLKSPSQNSESPNQQ
jgi:hypothetical protein